MGRPKLWTERILVSLPEGATERIDAVLKQDEGERRLDFIRTAIDAEAQRRGGVPPIGDGAAEDG